MRAWILVALLYFASSVNIVFSLNCYGKMDLVIAIPGSPEQVPQDEFNRLEDFLHNLIHYYYIAPGLTSVDIILYGKNPVTMKQDFPYLYSYDANAVISLLTQRQLHSSIYGGQNVPKAIDAMIELHQKNKKPNVPQLGIIMTYGSSDLSGSQDNEVAANMKAAAQRAKDAGIIMFAASANGSIPGFYYLTSGDYCRLFGMGSYRDLGTMLPYIASSVCYELDPNVNPAPGKCFPEVKQPDIISSSFVCRPYYHEPYPDYRNCVYFFTCGATGRHRVKCAGGTVFNWRTRRCDHKENVYCWNKAYCPHIKGLYPHPRYCNQYLNCNQRVAHVQTCPVNLVFNPNGYCDHSQNVNCYGRPIAP